MDLGLISVRYARALLKAEEQTGLSDQLYSDMSVLADSYCKVPQLRAAIDNPMLSKAQKKNLLVVASGNTSCKLSITFFELVLKEMRESIMQFIANSFITLYRKQNNLIRAKLTTASRLSSAVEERLKQLVESKTNGKVDFETETDPSLIGGFILEYDTYRMDTSVKSQLNNVLSKLK